MIYLISKYIFYLFCNYYPITIVFIILEYLIIEHKTDISSRYNKHLISKHIL